MSKLVEPFSFRGYGLPHELVRQLERLGDAVRAISAGTRREGTATEKAVPMFTTREEVLDLLKSFAAPPVSGTTGDSALDTIGTGTGTVTSVNVSGGSTGFGFSGGPLTSAGTITMSVTDAATARAALGIDAVATKKSNLSAAAAPTVNDDAGDGYAPGSLWLDLTADNAYLCLDPAAGAAVWRLLN